MTNERSHVAIDPVQNFKTPKAVRNAEPPEKEALDATLEMKTMLDEVMGKMEMRHQESLNEIREELRELKAHITDQTPRGRARQPKNDSFFEDVSPRSSPK